MFGRKKEDLFCTESWPNFVQLSHYLSLEIVSFIRKNQYLQPQLLHMNLKDSSCRNAADRVSAILLGFTCRVSKLCFMNVGIF